MLTSAAAKPLHLESVSNLHPLLSSFLYIVFKSWSNFSFFFFFCLEVCHRVKRLWEFGSHCRVIAKTYLPKLLSNGDNPLESVFYSFNFRQNCRKKPFYTANVSLEHSSRVYKENKIGKGQWGLNILSETPTPEGRILDYDHPTPKTEHSRSRHKIDNK